MSEFKQILILEDEAITAFELESTIKSLGEYSCITCASALDVVDALSEEKIDLAFLDINIDGDRDGIWVANYLNKMGVKFIFITSQGDRETIKRATATGPAGYLIKPFNLPDIEAVLRVAENFFAKENGVRKEQRTSVFVKDN